MHYQEIEGDLIALAKEGYFDVIAHGCNCFCTMGAGIAPKMAEAFGCDEFCYENEELVGQINKLGTIDYENVAIATGILSVVNAYTQYGMGPQEDGSPALDYRALSLCLTKINHIFKGKHIGLPQIGCGLAGGDWASVKGTIHDRLKDCKVTFVIFKQ